MRAGGLEMGTVPPYYTVYIYTYIYVYVYIYILHIYIYVCIYIYMYIPSYLNDIPRISSPRSQLVPKERFRADGRQLDLRWKSEIRDRFSPSSLCYSCCGRTCLQDLESYVILWLCLSPSDRSEWFHCKVIRPASGASGVMPHYALSLGCTGFQLDIFCLGMIINTFIHNHTHAIIIW